jgi:transcriptional regulator with XRE-family HTH domain
MAVRIGGRIKEARKSKRWVLRELAVHSGLDVSRIGNYESGERMPGPAEVLALAGALGESAPYLMCLVDDAHPEQVRDSEEAALLELYRTVDPEDRRRVIERLGALALLKKEAIQDEALLHLSARDKPLDDNGKRARARSRRKIAQK